MEPQNRDVGRKLFLFTIAMFTVPVIAFLVFRTHVFGAGAVPLGFLVVGRPLIVDWMDWSVAFTLFRLVAVD